MCHRVRAPLLLPLAEGIMPGETFWEAEMRIVQISDIQVGSGLLRRDIVEATIEGVN